MKVSDTNYEGISSEEAQHLLERFGPNTLLAHQRSIMVQLLAEFWSPITVVLLIAAGISVFVGNHVDAILIFSMVMSGTLIDFAQTYRSQRTINKLRASVASVAAVRRDRAWCQIARIQLVPGDVIKLSAGDMVPADAQLFESRSLFVQQAALTGESIPVEKQPSDEPPSNSAAARNMVFLGTSVMSGYGTALVVATGNRTAYGNIAARLSERPMETAFDRGLKDFSLLITKSIFVLVIFVLTINLVKHRPVIDSLLFAVSLAVGLTPDFLPMITSVILARGASRLADQNVVVKSLRAIQNLGSADIFCTDKTGTITSGEMKLRRSFRADGTSSDCPLSFAVINSTLQSGISSPLDAAIMAASGNNGVTYKKVDEIPFDFIRRRVSIVCQDHDEGLTLICKGAPEYVIPLSPSVRLHDGTSIQRDHDQDQCINALISADATEGRRVLAVASRRVTFQNSYTASDEQDLILEGFLSFEDPLLPESKDVISDLHRDGVRVIVITGDNDLVAQSVCQQAKLPDIQICSGEMLDVANDTALVHIVEQYNVFARVSPDQKLRIVNALKRAGHTVAFMGDGVNDAPALHAADVGIAAPRAVDVAREAADVVFTIAGLKVLHVGIREGRRAFGNVMKYLLMGTSSNFGNVLSMALASVILPFLPLMPTQILLNNFLYDLSQLTIPSDRVDTMYFEGPQRWDVAIIRRFMLGAGPVSSVFDFLTFFVLLRVLHASIPGFRTAWFVESLVTQTAVLLIIRTAGAPWRSKPSIPVTATVIITAAIGIVLPYSPLAGDLQFEPLPLSWMLMLTCITATYLICIEFVKRAILAVTQRSLKQQQNA